MGKREQMHLLLYTQYSSLTLQNISYWILPWWLEGLGQWSYKLGWGKSCRLPEGGHYVILYRCLSLRWLVQIVAAPSYMDAHCHPSAGKVPTVGSHDCGLGHGCRLGGSDNPPVPSPLPSLLLSSSLQNHRRHLNVIVCQHQDQSLMPVPPSISKTMAVF